MLEDVRDLVNVYNSHMMNSQIVTMLFANYFNKLPKLLGGLVNAGGVVAFVVLVVFFVVSLVALMDDDMTAYKAR